MENVSTTASDEEKKLGDVLGEDYTEALGQHRKYLFFAFAGSLYATLHLFAVWVHLRKRERDGCGLRACGVSFRDERVVSLVVWAWISAFLTTCVVLAILGSGSTTCFHGMLWEYHAAFWIILMLGKVLELIIYGSDERELGLMKLLLKLNLGTLAAVDTYTDVTFIVIAHSCGEHQWIWVVSTVALIVGVGLAQFCLVGCLLADVMSVCKVGHLDAVADLVAAPHRRIHDGENDADALVRLQRKERYVYEQRQNNTALAALARCFCEDGIQAAIQITFLALEGQANPQVVASIVVGFLSSCASCAYASYFAPSMSAPPEPDEE